jgi:ABC-type Mn2+/Zn2+ transport system ATPase subunit/ABC-type uncharacterized transport system permease subunit
MDNLYNIFEIGFYDGLTWFPIVLAIGILYKYLKTIDVSVDGIAIMSAIIFVASYNYWDSLLISLIITASCSIVGYIAVSFMISELAINNLLAGIIFTLVLHSLSVIAIGESLPLKYENLTFLNSNFSAIAIAAVLAISTECFFRTNLGIKLKVAADNPKVNITSNPRMLGLLLYIISGFILSIGVIQYTTKIGLARSGGGFEFLITALSSFLFVDRIVDIIIQASNSKKENYSYSKYLIYSMFQSPVFKALLGSVLFQIIVLLIIYYTSNPAYWKLIFGFILLATVAKPKIRIIVKSLYSNKERQGVVLEKTCFQYDNGYESKEIFKNLDYNFKPGINIIWGNNGTGKTTLLKLISGDLMPSYGAIFKNGNDITQMKRHKRKVFYFNQVPYDSLSTNNSVFENIIAVYNSSMGDLKIARPSSLRQNPFSRLEAGKQDSFWVQQTGSLSGGQAQKLNLFLCSLSDTDLILADEPTSGMDMDNFQLFVNFIEEIRKSFKDLIIVTHDDRLKKISGNHILLMNNELKQHNYD